MTRRRTDVDRTRIANVDRLWDGGAARPDERATVTASVNSDGLRVQIDAPLHGDPAPDRPPGRCPRLWDHEVVELFLVGPDDDYLELEFGPFGHYLVLQLHGRRNIVTDAIDIDYRVTRESERWNGEARVPARWLPAPVQRWNAFAIHGHAGSRRHLAAHPVPGDKPDFHRLELFPSWD